MTDPHRNRIIITMSLFAITISLLVVTGWVLGIQAFQQIVPGFVAMVFNTSFCFILFAGALLLSQYYHSRYKSTVFFVLSLAGTLIGALTLAEFLFHFNAGIDQLFISDPQKINADHLYPGRMAYNAAIGFTLFGSGMLLVNAKNGVAKTLAQYLFHLVSILAAIALIGYLYGVSFFNTLFFVSSMATHTAILFLLLSVAASLLNPQLGITRLFTGNLVGNQMARRLFGLIVLMVLAFGSVRVQTQYYKVFSVDTGIPLLAVCFLLISLVIIWSTAGWLNRIDLNRTKAEAEVKLMNAELEKRVAQRSAEIQKSEAKYRSLIGQASDAIYVLDLDGNFTDANASMCRMIGYSRDELLHMNVAEIVDPEELKIDPLPKGKMKENESVIRERRLKRRDGSVFIVEINVKLFSGETVLVIARDVSDRKRMESELRSSEQKYRLMFDANPSPLWMVDKEDLSIIAVNDAAAGLYGYSKAELMAQKVTIVRKKDELPLQEERFSRELANSSRLEIAMHVKKDGTEMYIQIVAHDIEFEGRKVRLSMTNDITERIRAEESLQKSEANLQTILNTTNIVFVTFDRELQILAFNPKAADFVRRHYKRTLEKKQKLTDYLSEGRSAQVMEHIANVFNGKNISYEINYQGHWYNVSFSPVINDQKLILGMLLTLEEVTARKNAEQDLKDAYNQIQNQINSIKDMAWKQSHLIRSPLANLKALTSILHEDPSDRATLRLIQDELNRMDSIIIEMAEDASEHGE